MEIAQVLRAGPAVHVENCDTEHTKKFCVWKRKFLGIWKPKANASLVGVCAQGLVFSCLCFALM